MVDEAAIAERYRLLKGEFDERRRRLWAAAEARSAGHGGIAAVVRATGISESTVLRGLADLDSGERVEPGRMRRPGAGRRPIEETDPTLVADLERLVDPATRGDPDSPLRWTSKSAPNLAQGLRAKGHTVVDRTVSRLLRRLGYRLQANRKTLEGSRHPDRDAQFAHINQRAREQIAAGQPMIGVDTKKKELVGPYKAVGREYEPSGRPVGVNVHDFPDPSWARPSPYGVYDLAHDEGFVSVGVSADTAQLSVASIRAWWSELGHERFPEATRLTITADCGGSNSPRVKLWKTELQQLSTDTGLEIEVCHYPPGTSKWNKVEHRLFSFIAMSWRGKPLLSHQVIIDLIAGTTTSTGLKVYARLDPNEYLTGVQVSEEQVRAVNITGHEFHPEWNYVIRPSLIKS